LKSIFALKARISCIFLSAKRSCESGLGVKSAAEVSHRHVTSAFHAQECAPLAVPQCKPMAQFCSSVQSSTAKNAERQVMTDGCQAWNGTSECKTRLQNSAKRFFKAHYWSPSVATSAVRRRSTREFLHIEQRRVGGELRQAAAQDERARHHHDRAAQDRDGAGIAVDTPHERGSCTHLMMPVGSLSATYSETVSHTRLRRPVSPLAPFGSVLPADCRATRSSPKRRQRPHHQMCA